MQELIHLSDLHINGHNTKYAQKIFNCISAYNPQVPVIITGDVVNNGLEHEYQIADTLFEILSDTNPVLMVPGNHDYAWQGNIFLSEGCENWDKYLGITRGWPRSFQIPWMSKGLGVFIQGDYAYIGIDSGDPRDKALAARGHVSEGLCDRLKSELQRNAEKIRVVFLHHHPFTDGIFTKLEGSERFLEAVSGNCELLLFGHDHEYGLWRGKNSIPLTISSHKSTTPISGDCLAYTHIEITNRNKITSSLRIV